MENPEKYKNKLLKQHAEGTITIEQLDFECAIWYLECFHEINPKPLPTPPQRYQEYEMSTWSEKRDVPKEFWLRKDVKDHLDQKQSVKEWNKSTLEKLHYFKSKLPESDFVSRSQYDEKIRDFEYARNNT